MSGVMLGAEVKEKVEGWCKVCHQSTDFLIIGIIAIPTKESIETARSAFALSSIDECSPMIAA